MLKMLLEIFWRCLVTVLVLSDILMGNQLATGSSHLSGT